MARLGTRQQLVLLAAAACVPVSLGLAAWPPAPVVRPLVVVPTPVPVQTVAAAEALPVEVELAPEPPTEPEVVPVEIEPEGIRYGHDFLWVAHDVEDGKPFAVLSLEPDDAWAAGPPRLGETYGLVGRRVDESAVPAELRGLVGERLQLQGSTRSTCTAVVGQLRLVSQIDGELAMLLDDGEEVLDEERLDDQTEPEWEALEGRARKRVADGIWRDGRRLLVAPLALDETCEEGDDSSWARPLRRGPVERLASNGLRKRATLTREFLALPELVELSQQFDDYVASVREHEREAAAEAQPDAPEGEAEPAAPPLPRLSDRVKGRQWRTGDGAVAFVTMITEGDELSPEACTDIPSPLWAIAAVDADGKKTRPFVVGTTGAPRSILDLDGDGQWELLVLPDVGFADPEILAITPEGLEAVTSLPSVPYFGCPC
jgi:hypothetical protein